MGKSRNKAKVAIQGIKGSFHYQAASLFFKKDIDVLEYERFDDVFKAVQNKDVQYGIFAIENTVAGSLLDNYRLLLQSNKKVFGEILLRVEQNLVGVQNSTFEDIKEVYSHPVAIAQTRRFFDKFHKVKLIETVDTAESALFILNENNTSKAAICSADAAKLYNLKILAKGIETHKRNFTRFLIISSDDSNQEMTQIKSKSSICFTANHEVGSLSKVLTIFSFYGLNMTKIQSLPILGKEWQYQFYVDLTFSSSQTFEDALNAVKPLVIDLNVLGVYAESKHIINELENIETLNTTFIQS
jgi:prephenate dehydratase